MSLIPNAPPTRADVPTDRWAAVKLLAIDVDGVLTDGRITFHENGGLSQTFSIRDGFGLVAARRAGITVAWISGRESPMARRRFEELELHHCILDCDDKAAAVRDLQEQLDISPNACCFIGDDVPDLAAFAVSGLTAAVADAAPAVTTRADYVTRARGGHGAVREVVDLILHAQGYYDLMVDMFANAEVDEPAADDLQR